MRPRFTLAEATAIFVVVAFLFTTAAGNAMPSRHNRPVPILMYHVIADAPAGAAFPNLFVTPSQEMFTLSRIRIDGVDHLDGFAQKLQSLTP
jgi:hypothetical protein